MKYAAAAAGAKSLQSCPTLCDPIDGTPPAFPIPGILQARTLVWVVISFSNAWKWKVKVKLFSRVRLLATQWTSAYQAPLSMGFSRQEYWSGVPSPSPEWGIGGKIKSLYFWIQWMWESFKPSRWKYTVRNVVSSADTEVRVISLMMLIKHVGCESVICVWLCFTKISCDLEFSKLLFSHL